MARKILFKRPDDRINIGGQVIHQGNITPELYDYLVGVAAAHADHFDVTEEEEEKPKAPKAKPQDKDKEA